MPIVLQCPGCGSRYQVNTRLAGKQTKCQCGEMMQVPGPAVKTADLPRGGRGQEAPGRPLAPPPESEPLTDAESTPLPAETLREMRNRTYSKVGPIWHALQQRKTVAVLCVCYGSIMALVLLGHAAVTASFGVFEFLNLFGLAPPLFAVMIAAGGVLLLKGHPHGPACAGLSSALLCFFPLCSAIRQALVLLTAIRPGALLLLLLYTVVVYSIPVFVIVWALREEDAKQAEEDDH